MWDCLSNYCIPTPHRVSGGPEMLNNHINLFQQMFIKHLLWARNSVIVCVLGEGMVTMVIKSRVTDLIYSQDEETDIKY